MKYQIFLYQQYDGSYGATVTELPQLTAQGRTDEDDQRRYVIGAEAQQIGVACWSMGLPVPELEQQCTLEQEVGRMVRDRQPLQQPLQAIACQDQVEVLLRCVRVLLQPRTDRRCAVCGHAVIASM